jgi:hypothetical protein
MTLTMMKLLKASNRSGEMDIDTKLLVCAVSTADFHGSFRIRENLACKTEAEFDPNYSTHCSKKTLR